MVILVIVAAIIFAAGGGLGYILQKNPGSSSGADGGALATLGTTLKSKAINSISAFGNVTNISGRTVTLTYNKETIQIKMRDDAKFYTFVQTKDPKTNKTISKQQAAKFTDIKIGDNLNVSVKITADNKLEGSSAIIFAPASK